jgi:uncharacterized protein (TIGR04255 family)
MSQYPTLQKAPIEEAIIGFIVPNEEHKTYDAIKACAEKFQTLSEPYLFLSDIKTREFKFEISDNSQFSQGDEMRLGSVLKSEHTQNVLELVIDRFSLHKLKPYTNWETFQSEFKDAFELYQEYVGIKKVESLSIRYINKFTVPLNNWDEYINIQPGILLETKETSDIDVQVTEVTSRNVLSSEILEASAEVITILKPNGRDELLDVLIDIDVRSIKSITSSNIKAFEATFKQLRHFKNHIFFANVPKAEELFHVS